MTLGEIIKEYRTAHHYSMEDMANLCGISKAYVSLLEKNYNPTTKGPIIPSLQVIKKVASAVGVSFDELIQALNEETVISLDSLPEELSSNIPAIDYSVTVPTSVSDLSSEETYIISKYRSLPVNKRKNVIDYFFNMTNKLSE